MEIEEDMKMGDISSNMGGYPSSKDDTRKNDVEESLDKNDGSKKIGNEGINQGGETQRFGEENVEEELGKEKNLGKEDAKGMEYPREKKMDDPSFRVSLSFLDIENIKSNSSLHGDSWIYNEIMNLKKKLGKVQKD